MSFAKGCRRPNPVKLAAHAPAAEHPAIKARLAAHAAGAALPPSADQLPARPRADQGGSGSCTWGSFSIALMVACLSLGIPLGFVPSQDDGYRKTRALERAAATPAGQPLAALTDSGADLEDVYAAASRYGVRPMKVQVTPDGRFYDLWTADDVAGIAGAPPANVNDEPDTGDLELAAEVAVKLDVAKHTIDPRDPNVSDLMAAALDASPALPIHACGWVDTAFEELSPGEVAQAPDPNDAAGGGHAYWFSAYRTNAAGEREFKLENSWGSGWNENGAAWVSLAFIRAQWAMYVLDVTVQKEAA